MNYTDFEVRGEWLCKNGEIAYRTLRWWFQYFELIPVMHHEYGVLVFDYWWSERFNVIISVWGHGGYGVTKEDFESGKYLGTLFYVGNADLDRPSIYIKY